MADISTIIEGSVKFRDSKKWKSRWCVVRKLSPVADCLHLQLYRDSKDRYRQGPTKASLSLQHFLAVNSGFTLDKESNTLALVCQDVTVVLAFDTREQLMQWRVKMSQHLGEDKQFLVQVSAAPPRGKVPLGPARLHVHEHRFCLTVGVPPRLVGHWQIRQLRKYGVVENKFCFEGGSSCGKGEGLYVLVTDQAENITRAFNSVAEGRLAVKRRPLARNMLLMASPHCVNPRVSDLSCRQPRCSCSRSHDNLLGWLPTDHWSRHRGCDTTSAVDYSERTSWWPERGRCASCVGELSCSSTLTNFDRNHRTCGSTSTTSDYDRATASSLGYWTPAPSERGCDASTVHTNYDVPRPAPCTSPFPSKQYSGANCRSMNYDTPGNVKDKHLHQNTSVEIKEALCPCHRVICWAGSWLRLPYLLSNTFLKVKLDGEGKMPFVNCRGENYTCKSPINNCQTRAKMAEEEKDAVKRNGGETSFVKVKPKQNANVKIIPENMSDKTETVIRLEPKSAFQYENFEFTKSLKYYENLKDLIPRTNGTEIVKFTKDVKGSEETLNIQGDGSCSKCGHAYSKSTGKPSPQNDYLIMEPSPKHSLQRLQSQQSLSLTQSSPTQEKFTQGYLPMLPISSKTEELQHSRVRLNEKSQSFPILPLRRKSSYPSPCVYNCISESNSPYSRRRLMTVHGLRTEIMIPSCRKRSSSMDSSRYFDNLESIQEKVVSPIRTLVNSPIISNTSSIDSISDLSTGHRMIPTSNSKHGLSMVDSEYVPCKSSSRLLHEETSLEGTTVNKSASDNLISNHPTVKIKRSASIPCKSVYNRDSSSSNDSGVSTGSLLFPRRDFLDSEFHSTRKRSTQHQDKVVTRTIANVVCVLSKSKSVEPFEEVNTEFEKNKHPLKSLSAGACDPPTTTQAESKGYLSPSHSSTSTSDMSDYIETLSLSSYTSSDTPDSFQSSHSGVSSQRPRSGGEYRTINRLSLEAQVVAKSSERTE